MHSITKNIRKSILHMVHYSKSSHVGTCLSIVEILYTLYFKVMNIDPKFPGICKRCIANLGNGEVRSYA